MSKEIRKFWTSLLDCETVKLNPILSHHFNQERRSLNEKKTIDENNVECKFCFTSKAPKVVIKSRRNKSNKKVKKVFLFCNFCGNKKTQLCGELNRFEKLKTDKDDSQLQKKTKEEVQETSFKQVDPKSKEEKKKKKRDQNAGLIIPPSMSKPSPGARSFVKNAHLLKMIKTSEDNEKEDRLKSFLKL